MPRPKSNHLEISPVRLSDGTIQHRVAGHILGRRIRRRFGLLVDAEAYVADQLANVAPIERVARPIVSTLNADQIADAERARVILPSWATQAEAAEFYVRYFKPVTPHDLLLSIGEYKEEKLNEAKNRQFTADTMEFVLKAYARAAQVSATSDITVENTRSWVFDTLAEAQGRSPVTVRTQRDRYDHLNRFFRWLITKKRLLRNPIDELQRPEVEYGPPAVLSLEQVQRLLDTAWTDPAGPVMLPFFATCLLSGARPFEVRRAQEAHYFIEEDQGEPIFEVWESKTPWRTVELREPLLGILRHCKDSGINLAFFSKRIFDRIRHDAGVYKVWSNDIQRHTYASFHYAKHRDVKWLEKNLGTSERVLFTHYIRRTIRKSDAEAFERLTVNWNAPRRDLPATTLQTTPSR